MKKSYRLVIFSLIIIFMLPSIFADSLTINTLTKADKSDGSFFVSNNNTREIEVNIEYLPKIQIEGQVKFSLDVSPNSSNLFVDMSSQDFYFFNNFSIKEKLNIQTKTVTDLKNIRLKVEVFDKYNNLLETKIKYITIIPNNSEEYYAYTPNHIAPKFLGYNLSRSVSVINNKNDYDIISIFINSDEGYIFSIDCKPNDSAIIINYNYIDYNQTDINISIDNNQTLESSEYFINCKINDSSDVHNLKQIKLRYTNKEESDQPIIQKIVTQEKVEKITGFFSFSKMESSKTLVLLAIFILLVILIVFFKSN